MLLKASLLEVSDFVTLNTVLLQGPSRLFTQDILRAWQHYKGGFDVREIAALNRSEPSTSSQASQQAATDAAARVHQRQRAFDMFVSSA
jgi:hypothetical protein